MSPHSLKTCLHALLVYVAISSFALAQSTDSAKADDPLVEADIGPAASVGTNGVILGPWDTATEIARNPYLKLQTNDWGDVILDYQYESTNATTVLEPPTIEIDAEGARAEGGRHTVRFTGNLMDEDSVVITLPDQQVLQGRVVALSLADDHGQRQWLGEIQDCQGHLVDGRTDQVLYVGAFHGIRADVLFTYGLNSIQQDIVIRERPVLAPELDPESARVEVWTEFLEFPGLARAVRQVNLRGANGAAGLRSFVPASDEELDFGTMKMVGGRAFYTGRQEQIDLDSTEGVPVVKQWFRRTCRGSGGTAPATT